MSSGPDGERDDRLSKTPEKQPAAVDDTDDEQDEEPRLKYARLTGSLGTVYKSGDSTSSSAVAGDKMVIGTHNGNVHVLHIPTFRTLRTYRVHSASITSVSISPRLLPVRPPPQPAMPADDAASTAPSRIPRQPLLPATPSNSMYIATSSIDGHVCVASLVDQKDVTLRNFARPVNAVALSPTYKSDRTYLSGGLAGNLILTVGGRKGVSANANMNSAAATAQGFLGSIGLASNAGSDRVLHTGEGRINAIVWSLSGKFVVWVNEQGIKIMRSNLHLASEHPDHAWRRIAHIDRPSRPKWEEMAGVWRARCEWIEDGNLESDDDQVPTANGSNAGAAPTSIAAASLQLVSKADRSKKKRTEKLVVGWGDTAWVLHVKPEPAGERTVGSATIVHQ